MVFASPAWGHRKRALAAVAVRQWRIRREVSLHAQAHRGDLCYEAATPCGARFRLVLPSS
jgi:hypothetical protein